MTKPEPKSTENPWSKKNVCEVCHETCTTPEQKKEHETKQAHIKKFAIKTFLNTYLKSSNSNIPSALQRRFRTSKEKAAGIECLHEFRFPWCATGWWACSICYDAGCSLEQAEHHVRSPVHLTAYLEEFDPDKAASIKKFKGNPVEYYTELIKARDELFEVQGEIPPEIFELNLAKEEAMVKLLVANLPQPPKETLTLNLGDDETVKRAIVRCTVCHEVIPCFRKNLHKVWNVHENTPEHRKASAILGILTHLPCEQVLDDEDEENGALAYSCRRINTTYFGPICGKSHLLTSGKQNFCLLCQCEVRSIGEHFASEYHILRFLCTKKAQEILPYIHQSPDVRRDKMMNLLSKITMDNDNYRRLNSQTLPAPILDLRSVERLDAEEIMPPLTSFGANLCLICNVCNTVITVSKDDALLAEGVWNEHVTSADHFDVLARRACYRFYDEFFVPILPKVKTIPPALHGVWKTIVPEGKVPYKIQTQCDVGLEWIIEDQEAGEVVCTLCSRIYKKDSIDGINNHIRSYMHLDHYLQVSNRDFLAILKDMNSEKAILDLLLDWLQRTYCPVQPFVYNAFGIMHAAINRENWGQIRVYSPEKATSIARKLEIPQRASLLQYYDPECRSVAAALWPVIDQVAVDGQEKEVVNLQDALKFSSCRIVWMDDEDNKRSRKWILRCMACRLLIPTTVETLAHDVFDVHMFSEEHDRRIEAFGKFDSDRCCFAESTSNHTVKQFIQPVPNKKVSWQFNQETNTHSFVLTVVGLEDLVERKSSLNEPDRPTDFFCRLCALSFPRRHLSLEQHVRSRNHIYNYIQKYEPMKIHELEAVKADPRAERNLLAKLLQQVQPSKEYPIPVYDPIGEQERTRLKMEEEETEKQRQENLAISRKKAEDKRIAREEQKRMILAKEMAERDKIKEEAHNREKKMLEKHIKLKEEAERIKVELAREQVKKVAEAASKAREFAIQQAEKSKMDKLRNDNRMREDRKAQLVSELAKLQSLKAKEEEMRKEKLEKEKETIRAMAQKTQALFDKHNLSIPTQRNAPQMMKVPPPPVPNYSVPPPGYGQPKPSFNTFVPSVGAMPVYPMGAVDMDISGAASRSPSPIRDSRRRRSRSRSRDHSNSRDRRGRRRSRSRSPPRQPHGLRDISPSSPPRRRRSLSAISISPPHNERKGSTSKKSTPPGQRPSLVGKAVDSFITNPGLCSNKHQLVDYMWRQGAERIPQGELPTRFSARASAIEGNVGIESIYEVVCIDSSDLDTYYCSICGNWGTAAELIQHISSQQHKMAYLFRNHKDFHQTIMTETNAGLREKMLIEFINRVWKKEKPYPGVSARLRTVLDKTTIQRVCPDYVQKPPPMAERSLSLVEVPAPVSRDVLGGLAGLPPSFMSTMTPVTMPSAQSVFQQPTLTSNMLPSLYNPNLPPPGMPPAVPVAVKSSRIEEKKRSRSPRGSRKRSRSRDRRRSPSPRRRDASRRSRSPRKKRSRSPTRDKDRDRKRSRSRSRDHGRDRDRHTGGKDRDDRIKTSSIISSDDRQWVSDAERFLKKIAAPPTASPTLLPASGMFSVAGLPKMDTVPPARDESAIQRKILGLMYTMQREAEIQGRVDPERINQMTREMGINLTEAESQEVMNTLLNKMGNSSQKTSVNLAEFGIQSNMQQQPVGYQPYQQYQQPYHRKEDPTLTGILSTIPQSLAELGKSNRPLSPLLKPMPYQFTRPEDIFKGDGMSLVYPNDPEELEREKKEKAERKRLEAVKINATIEELRAKAEKLQNTADDDDDWEGLESDMDQLLGTKEAPAPAPSDTAKPAENRLNSIKFGLPSNWQQPVQQPVRSQSPEVEIIAVQEMAPIAPGQKMLLPRTILPNGKSVVQPEPAVQPIQPQRQQLPSTTTQYSALSGTSTSISQAPPAGISQPVQQQQYIPYQQQQYQPQQTTYTTGQQYIPPANFQQPPPNFYPQGYQTAPPQQYMQQYQQPGVPGLQPPGVQPQQPFYGGYNQQYRY